MTLQEYLYEQYGLVISGSEIDEILSLARQEIEIPSDDEIGVEVDRRFLEHDKVDYTHSGTYAKGIQDGIHWALFKVRNPYLKEIRFKEDPDEFFKK